MAELVVRGVSVRFGGIQAVSDVDLAVLPGRVTGLIGPNGAGKTTLFNVITGIQGPTTGRVLFDGRDVTRLKPHQRSRLGLARTFQRLELFGTLSARENVQTAMETAGRAPNAVDAQLLLERVGAGHVADEPADLLPTGLARLVELARALATVPSVLLLDEPSSGLGDNETAALGQLLQDVASYGVAVLLVEHDMSLVMNVSSEVAVLDHGSLIAQGAPSDIQQNPLVQSAYLGTAGVEQIQRMEQDERIEEIARLEQMEDAVRLAGRSTGTLVSAEAPPPNAFPPPPPPGAPVPGAPGAPAGPGAPLSAAFGVPAAPLASPRAGAELVGSAAMGSNGNSTEGWEQALQLVDIHAGYGRIEVVSGVSLSVARGSVLALLGPNGAGKSTLLKVASGQMSPMAGKVMVHGRDVTGKSGDRLVRQGLCAIPEGRSVFPNLTVAENIRMYSYCRKGAKAADLEEQSFERFPGLRDRRKQLAGRLSGGEQQALSLARALCSGARVLLVDEMSMGLAPLIIADLYERVSKLVREEGVAVVVVEQFAKTALAIANEAAVMVHGSIVRRGSPSEIESELVHHYMGQTTSPRR